MRTETTTEHRPEWMPPETEREQAIRLAEEALEQAWAAKALADRLVDERTVALYELQGRGDEPYPRLLRANLSGDRSAAKGAKIEFWAEAFLARSTPPPAEIADEVTAEVARIRLAREH